MNYAVTLIEKEYRPANNIWVTTDSYQVVVKANSKQEARKIVRADYQDLSRYNLGKVYKTDKPVGIHSLLYKTLKGGNPKCLQPKNKEVNNEPR